jgi:hypothetical protein
MVNHKMSEKKQALTRKTDLIDWLLAIDANVR